MRKREKRKRAGQKQQAPAGACWEKGVLMERQEVRENIREEMIRWELKFIGREDNVEDSKPVIGKGGKGGSGRPNAILEFFNQYAIGGG